MAKAWSYWLPDLLPHVAGCPVLLAEHELLRAAQVFFRETRAWQETVPSLSVTVAGGGSITITNPDAGHELVRIENAWLDGIPLGVTTADDLDAAMGDDWTTHTGTPSHIYQITPGVAMLYPKPIADSATGLKVRVSVCPSDAATSVPDEMAVKFRDAIASGAKARLMIYPDKPWTNTAMAPIHAASFEAATGRGNVTAARSNGQARKPASPKWC